MNSGLPGGDARAGLGQGAVIREVADRLLAGEPLRSMTRVMNDRHGFGMVPRQWGRVLRSPRDAGAREHRGQIVKAYAWEPILDPQRWERVKAALPEREKPGRPPKHPLVGGISRCGVCGTQLGHDADATSRRR